MYQYSSHWPSGQQTHPAPHHLRLSTLVLLVLLGAALCLLVWTVSTADQVSPAMQLSAPGSVTIVPCYPPGIEEYYYWNQGQPQPAPAE